MLSTPNPDHAEEQLYSAFLYRLIAQSLREKLADLATAMSHLRDQDLIIQLAAYLQNLEALVVKLEFLAELPSLTAQVSNSFPHRTW